MGYNLYVTRANEWFEAETAPITLEEWLEFVEADPEMRLDGYAEAKFPKGEVLRIDDPGMAVWVGHPRHDQDYLCWIWHSAGRVEAKNPDPETRQQLYRIAESFGAKVQGEDGELYDAQGEMIPLPRSEPVSPDPQTMESTRKRPFWKFW